MSSDQSTKNAKDQNKSLASKPGTVNVGERERTESEHLLVAVAVTKVGLLSSYFEEVAVAIAAS